MSTTYRVLVSTDLGGDPDDIQSLVHLLQYTDILKIEGFISSPGPGAIPSVAGIREWIQRTDVDFLRSRNHENLMGEKELLAMAKQGAFVASIPGEGKSTEGSQWIVERTMAEDPLKLGRPLWLLGWGSMTDIAQALYDEPAIADKIRLYYISSNNTVNDQASRDYVYNGMKDKWPNLWWIENGILSANSRDTFRGYYQGGNQEGEWNTFQFINSNIRGRGTNHSGLFSEKMGDVFPVANWPKNSLKEGDSPSFLYLLSPVLAQLGNVDDPGLENWGGQFYRPEPDLYPNYYTDLNATAQECQATINKWRVNYLGHWKSRLAWYDDII